HWRVSGARVRQPRSYRRRKPETENIAGMKLTFRAKLILIVGAATLSILVVMGASTLIGLQQTSELHEVEHRMVPRLELAPRLSIEFRQLRRSYQDAVAAQDEVALRGSSQIKEKLLRRIA